MTDTDTLRDQMLLALSASTDRCARCKTCEVQATALLPLIEAREAAAAGRALTDAADDFYGDDGPQGVVGGWSHLSTVSWLCARARAASQAAPPEEKP